MELSRWKEAPRNSAKHTTEGNPAVCV
jgi:hypothetical protein